MRAPGRTVLVAARSFLAALAGILGSGFGCSGAGGATTYCVFENGALQPGACLTECQSRCALVSRAGCTVEAPDSGDESVDCKNTCDAAEKLETPTCRDADYAYWRCLRRAGEPYVVCDAQTQAPVLTFHAVVCVAERAARDAVCGSDGGVYPPSGDELRDAH